MNKRIISANPIENDYDGKLISAHPKIERAQISFLFENEQFFR